MDYGKKAIEYRKKNTVLRVISNSNILTKEDLSIFYTPGVAAVSKLIAEDKSKTPELTMKRNSVAVVTDGSAVLGLGNIGPEAALPVMEGKAMLFSQYGGIDAIPICLATQDTKEIIKTIKNIAPAFGGINLEDISAPRCFEIERKLQDIGIPVMHDDQHGTAVVVLAGLINALKVADKDWNGLKIVISGAGAAGTAITKIIWDHSKGKAEMIVLDSEGTLYHDRVEDIKNKHELVHITKNIEEGQLNDVIAGADVFIGVSVPNILTGQMVKKMNKKAIVFAMANPIPEIDPEEAKKAGALIVATGRSDYTNQLNNVLAFPGIFRGALDVRAERITSEMKTAASLALAGFISNPTSGKIIPSILDKGVTEIVAKAVAKAATQ